jgi:hypothetical protein
MKDYQYLLIGSGGIITILFLFKLLGDKLGKDEQNSKCLGSEQCNLGYDCKHCKYDKL